MDYYELVFHYVYHIPLWCILSLIGVFLFYKYLTWDFGVFEKYGHTGPTPYPLLGTAWKMLSKGIVEYDMDLLRRFKNKRVCSVFELGNPGLVILDVKLAKRILVKDFSHFTNRKDIRESRPPLDQSVLSLKDDHWRHVRSRISPIFSASHLKLMTPLIQKCTDSLIGVLEKYSESGQSLDAKNIFQSYTMDVIASTMFGMDVDSLNHPDHPFVEKAMSLTNSRTLKRKILLFVFFLFPKLMKLLSKLGIDLFEPQTMDYFAKHLEQAFSERHENQEDMHDFVSMMMKNEVGEDQLDRETNGRKWSSKGLTRTEIIAQMFIFFIAGFETTSSTMVMAAYCMVTNEDMQKKLEDEVDLVLGEEEPTYDNVHELTYLKMFIDEVLRLYGPGVRLLREAKDDIDLDGVFVPKGVLVWIPVAALHRDPELWVDPEKFDPERFSPERKSERDGDVFMPFGQGPRHCVAKRLAELELKIGLAKILQKCTLILDETQSPREIKLLKTRNAPEKPLMLKVLMR